MPEGGIQAHRPPRCCAAIGEETKARTRLVLLRLAAREPSRMIWKTSNPMELDENLQRALLRAQVITDEAMGRRVTNHAVLLQLDLLREAIHRGSYKLDTFRYRSLTEDTKTQVWGKFVSLSKVNSAKALFFPNSDAQNLDELQEALDNLRSMILDANELVLLLMSYPCLYRQPYSMHLLLDNCMFGRQMEVELVMNFLLSTRPHGSEELEVLPIVGPSKAGKTTLVAHICNDERVRDHFSEVIFLHDHDITGDKLATFREGSVRKKQNRLPKSKKGGRRLLIVVELAGNLKKDEWCRLNSACIPSGSKIIITSRSENIVKFGTTRALTLKYLSRDAYWYYFKTLTFESTDPEMHPRYAYVAMEIARLMDGTLFRANFVSKLLRDNFDIRYWCKILALVRLIVQKHLSRFGEHPVFSFDVHNRPFTVRGIAASSKDVVIVTYHQCHQRSSDEEVPNIEIYDLLYGSVKPHGKFEALAWRSRVPPYHSYVYLCEIGELKTIGVKRKRSMKRQATIC